MSAILLFAKRMKNNEIYDRRGNKLGTVADVMLCADLTYALYAVLSFNPSIGAGKKLFAVPIGALELDTENECFVLDVSKDRLAEAEGFDPDAPPELPDPLFTAALLGSDSAARDARRATPT